MAEAVVEGGGWWPPGKGEPGQENWFYERAELRLQHDGGDEIDVLLPTEDGDRALVAVPIDGLLGLLAGTLMEAEALRVVPGEWVARMHRAVSEARVLIEKIDGEAARAWEGFYSDPAIEDELDEEGTRADT